MKPQESRKHQNHYRFDCGLVGGGNKVYVNMEQASALTKLFNRKPALVAAKMVLHAQLLSGGLTLRRAGEVVELTPQFRRHVERHWLPFAKSVISSSHVLTVQYSSLSAAVFVDVRVA